MVYALLENVRSLYNVGAIFRTADGAGVSRIFLTGITGQPPHREIRKVALGAEESVPWEYHREATAVIRQLRAEEVKIVVLETTGAAVLFNEVRYEFPLCLVVGNEYHGISEETLALADMHIRIPMRGSKVSLNVSVAFGIAAYEVAGRLNSME